MGPAFSAVLAAASLLGASIAEEGAAFPRVKWGQTLEKLFVTFVVKSLDRGSVWIQCVEDRLRFAAADVSGASFAIDFELARDIDPDLCHWEHLKRPDRSGDGVLATLPKRFPIRWDSLAADTARYRKVIDRDWTREELEPSEADAFLSEHSLYLPLLTFGEEALNAAKSLRSQGVFNASAPGAGASITPFVDARKDVEVLIVIVRHSGCKRCKVADDTFAGVAKDVMRNKSRSKSWARHLRFAMVDARSQHKTARFFDARCAPTPPDCRHYAIARGGELEPVPFRARHMASMLLADLRRLSRRHFRTSSPGDTKPERAAVILAPAAAPEAFLAAHRARLYADISLLESGQAARELGLDEGTDLAVWPPGEAEPQLLPAKLRENRSAIRQWLHVRVLPLLANTSAYEDDDPYKDLGLPVARFFADRSDFEAEARAAVLDVARHFRGRVAFVARNSTLKSYEWRQHGLPGSLPAFGLGLSMAHNTTRYGFLETPANQTAEFWHGPARGLLIAFVEDALAGRLERAVMSEAPLAEAEEAQAASSMAVRHLVGRRCKQVVESSPTDVLIEAHDEWRRDHAIRTVQLDTLAPLLAPANITVYRLDLGKNECPRDVLPLIPAGYSGYFWVPRMSKQRKLSWQKCKKYDPDFERVLKFVKKHSKASLDTPAILAEIDAVTRTMERKAALQSWSKNWGKTATTGVALLIGALALGGARWRRRRRLASTRPSHPKGSRSGDETFVANDVRDPSPHPAEAMRAASASGATSERDEGPVTGKALRKTAAAGRTEE